MFAARNAGGPLLSGQFLSFCFYNRDFLIFKKDKGVRIKNVHRLRFHIQMVIIIWDSSVGTKSPAQERGEIMIPWHGLSCVLSKGRPDVLICSVLNLRNSFNKG